MNLTVQDTSSQGGAWVAGKPGPAEPHGRERDRQRGLPQRRRRLDRASRPGPAAQAPGWSSRTAGQVLDQQQVAELSQPFRRLGGRPDRHRTKASGLGLSIVAAIAEAHGGTLDLQARPGGGLRVCVDCPRPLATHRRPSRRVSPA